MTSPSKDQNIIEQRAFSTSDLKRKIVLQTRLLRLDPDNASAHFRLAVYHLRQKQFTKAKKEWKRAIQIIPDRHQFYGVWMCALYDYREFEEVLFLGDKYPESFFKICSRSLQNKMMGMCFLHLGDYEKAIKNFEKSLTNCKESTRAYQNWSLALYLQGKQEEALEMHSRAHDKIGETYKKEVALLKEELEREGSKGFEDLIKKKIEAFQYFIDMEDEGKFNHDEIDSWKLSHRLTN